MNKLFIAFLTMMVTMPAAHAALTDAQWKQLNYAIENTDGSTVERVLSGVTLTEKERTQLIEFAKDTIQKRYVEWQMSPGLMGRLVRFCFYCCVLGADGVFLVCGGIGAVVGESKEFAVFVILAAAIPALWGLSGVWRAFMGYGYKEQMHEKAIAIKHSIARRDAALPVTLVNPT